MESDDPHQSAKRRPARGRQTKAKEESHQHHREEWEEDLTSTQQLGLSGSIGRKKQQTFVEPIVRLNNFIAPTADLQYERSKTAAAASKFSSTNKQQ